MFTILRLLFHCSFIKSIFQKQDTFTLKAKRCCIFYNEENILIPCLHFTSNGFMYFGDPMQLISQSVSSETLGNTVLKIIEECHINNTLNDDDSDKSVRLLLKRAGVKSWKSLVTQWYRIDVDYDIDNDSFDFNLYDSAKNGNYMGKSDSDWKRTLIHPTPTNVGETIHSMMSYYMKKRTDETTEKRNRTKKRKNDKK